MDELLEIAPCPQVILSDGRRTCSVVVERAVEEHVIGSIVHFRQKIGLHRNFPSKIRFIFILFEDIPIEVVADPSFHEIFPDSGICVSHPGPVIRL